MSEHWRLAIWYAVWVTTGAAVIGAVIWAWLGALYAGAFGYGVGVGLVSFVSTALTVSLLTGRSQAAGMMIGGASFGARCVFAAVALGVPAHLELWPAVAMLVGFAAVYLSGNAALLPGVLMMGDLSARADAERSVDETVERRVEV